MNTICLDSYKLQKVNKPVCSYRKGYSTQETQNIAKELQKGYMKLLANYDATAK